MRAGGQYDEAVAQAVAKATEARLGQPFDAIVVGAGASGGMAAMLLTEAGMQVLLLDAGHRASALSRLGAASIRTIADPRLQSLLPPAVVSFGRRALRVAGKVRQPVQTKCFAWEMAPEAFVDDRHNPYVNEPGSRFDWFRARQLGGRMTIPGHGRQYYRLGEQDFAPQDGLSPPWPLSPGELEPWYGQVEDRLGLSGASEHSPWIPDGRMAETLKPIEAEAAAMERVRTRWPQTAQPILGRSAPPLDSVALAAATGRLTLRQGAVTSEVVVEGGKARGARWVDCATGASMEARAPIVFLCASALESTRILLSSRTAEGAALAARSGALGRYLMDHVVVSGEGIGGGLAGDPVPARPGRCVYLPRFDLREGRGGGRGYGVQVYQWSLGKGKSYFNGVAFAEMSPRPDNRVVLDPQRRDAWGLPVLRIACRHSEAELRLAEDQSRAVKALGEAMGVAFYRLDTRPAAPGAAIHECGTARMGADPADSVLDPSNQCWDAEGLYVTDASSFPSQGAQNPTLTLLALTARACAKAAGTAAATAPVERKGRAGARKTKHAATANQASRSGFGGGLTGAHITRNSGHG